PPGSLHSKQPSNQGKVQNQSLKTKDRERKNVWQVAAGCPQNRDTSCCCPFYSTLHYTTLLEKLLYWNPPLHPASRVFKTLLQAAGRVCLPSLLEA
ncbi:hypothetical protein VIGAN_07142900, partial [Vigna angularis var. angularis]